MVLYGPYAAPVLLGAVPIGWSRLELGRHRPVEVVIGFLFGVASAALLSFTLALW
jgi:membrane-associated phospholipid phosphatase